MAIVTYRKIRFTNGSEHTSGLVIPEWKFQNSSIEQLSRLFPYFEANKMKVLEFSPEYPTQLDAFEHEFAE